VTSDINLDVRLIFGGPTRTLSRADSSINTTAHVMCASPWIYELPEPAVERTTLSLM
jgi:hypothetical protein